MLSLKSVHTHPLLSGNNNSGAHHFSDVSIKCGSDIHCSPALTHRLLLGSVSPVLSSVFKDVPPYPECCLVLVDVHQQTLNDLLRFLSSEEINFSDESDYQRLLELMQLIDIDYVNKCSVIYDDNSNVSNLFDESECFSVESELNGDPSEKEDYSAGAPSPRNEDDVKSIKPTKAEQLFQIKSEYLESQQSSFVEVPISSPNTDTNTELMQACSFCEKCFATGEHLDKHIKYKHKRGRLQCSQCSFSTNDKHYLHKHVTTVHEKSVAMVECDLCSKRFVSKASVDRHKKMVHLRLKSFKCSQCNAAFSMNYDLDKHMRTHTGEKPFCCEMCGKSYSDPSSLSKHKATHASQNISFTQF